jgi:hypothetical protein
MTEKVRKTCRGRGFPSDSFFFHCLLLLALNVMFPSRVVVVQSMKGPNKVNHYDEKLVHLNRHTLAILQHR